MEDTRYAFANLGRAKSASDVRRSLNVLELPHRIIFLNEIGEGDKGYNDLALVREALGDTHKIIHADTKEPIAIPKAMKVLKTRKIWRGPGLKGQSPNRILTETWVQHEDGMIEVLLSGHFYAGAMNGTRKPLAKAFLTKWYRIMLSALIRAIRRHHRAGRHVTWFMDTNWRQFPKLHKDEVRYFGAPPDFGASVPAKGYGVRRTKYERKDLFIERLHDAHIVNARFYKTRKNR